MSVASRFGTFLANIKLTDAQKAAGGARREAVVGALNWHYWGRSGGTANSLYVGSWAKKTRIRPPRDVDVLFNLPIEVFNRFQNRTGNRQSQLLQEVKGVIGASFPNTAVWGSGPVVVVPFSAYNVEVVPAFPRTGGGHWVPMTDGGGRYKHADYAAEAAAIAASGTMTRDLVRMMKRWQGVCSVPIKSFHIELVATSFMTQWAYQGQTKTFYDWMVRDFLEHLVGRANTYVFAPGTGEMMFLGSAWRSRAESALARARKACQHEAAQAWSAAGDEWQKIFGGDTPKWL